MKLYLASGNPGKLRDFAGLGAELEMALLPGFDTLATVAETGRTFTANARLKAEQYSRSAPTLCVVADDSGLCVDALGGDPGVDSAIFAGRHGDDDANNALLLKRLADVPDERRGARFVCVLALARNGKVVAEFQGEARGRILRAARGALGFGYDPLFYSPAAESSFGELTVERKAAISHRGQAARGLLEWLRAHPQDCP